MINIRSQRAKHALNESGSPVPQTLVVVDMAILALATLHPRFRGGMAVTTQALLDHWAHDPRITWVPWVPNALLPYFMVSTASDETLRPPSPLDVMTAILRWWWQDVLHGRRPSHRDIAFRALATGTLTADELERVERVIWYSPGFPLPKPARGGVDSLPGVITIHDVAPLLSPQSGWTPRHRVTTTLKSITTDDHVICPSRATEQALEAVTRHTLPNPVHVQPWGISAQFTPAVSGAMVTIHDEYRGERLLDPQSYVLAVIGGAEPRKQIPLLTYTYERWAEAWSQTHSTEPPPLVLVGTGGALLRKRYGPWQHIYVAGLVDDETLVALYQNALALICPSADEGFGLPVLEAMACGCPVITTAGGSLPEVVGEAAAMMVANKPETWPAVWESVIRDADQRETMREAGLKRVVEFSWERCAQAYAEILVKASVPFEPN